MPMPTASASCQRAQISQFCVVPANAQSHKQSAPNEPSGCACRSSETRAHLNVAERDAGVESGGDEGVAEGARPRADRRRLRRCLPKRMACGVSVRRWILPGMARFEDQDLTGAELRECDLSRARLIGVVMQDAVIDGLVSNLVVNGVEVTSYVEAELDRRHPVRLLIRSADPADLRQALRQLRAGWAATIERLRGMPEAPNTGASAASGRR
jgi:hypothetical protein